MGGNRNGKYKTYRNLIIVWFLTGLWHGASMNFIFWGLFYGALIIIERLGLGKILEKLPPFVSTAYTFILVVIGWVFFDIETMPKAISYLKAMFAGHDFIDSYSLYQLKSYAIVFVLCIFASTDVWGKFTRRIENIKNLRNPYYYGVSITQVILILMCTCYLVDATYNPFLYFRF